MRGGALKLACCQQFLESGRRLFIVAEMRFRVFPRGFFVRGMVFLIFLTAPALLAQHSVDSPAQLAMKKFQLAPGLKIDLFAAEPQVMNPVSFSIDERGRIFVVETHRYGISIFDITQNQPWLLDDLSFRAVADREAFLSRTFATNLSLMTKDSELVRLVQDKAGTGRADTSSVYADGFNKITSPAWRREFLRVTAKFGPRAFRIFGTSKALIARAKRNSRELLFTGFGVHIGVTGHDLHGLRLGPDGKIYMSSGDRGFVVRTKEGKLLNYPDTGGVLRWAIRMAPTWRSCALACATRRNWRSINTEICSPTTTTPRARTGRG